MGIGPQTSDSAVHAIDGVVVAVGDGAVEGAVVILLRKGLAVEHEGRAPAVLLEIQFLFEIGRISMKPETILADLRQEVF